MLLQAIIFDYDGVLADTESLHLEAFQAALGPLETELSRADYFEHYLGLDDEGVFRAISERHGLAWSEARIRELVTDKTARFGEVLLASRHVLYPGVAECLREWGAQVAIAIASGSIRQEIEPVLAAEGLTPVVRVIVAAGETPEGKPAPDPYLCAIERLAEQSRTLIDARSCLAVEDSPWGIDSAHAAGIPVVALTTSYPARRLASAELVIDRLTNLSLPLMERVVQKQPADHGRRS